MNDLYDVPVTFLTRGFQSYSGILWASMMKDKGLWSTCMYDASYQLRKKTKLITKQQQHISNVPSI